MRRAVLWMQMLSTCNAATNSLPAFCQYSREGHLLKASSSDFHLIIFSFALHSTLFVHYWESFAICWEKPLQTNLTRVNSHLHPTPPAPSNTVPVTDASVSTGIYKYPPSLPFKNLILIDLVTYIHIIAIPSFPPALCSFHRWSFAVSTSQVPLSSIILLL